MQKTVFGKGRIHRLPNEKTGFPPFFEEAWRTEETDGLRKLSDLGGFPTFLEEAEVPIVYKRAKGLEETDGT